MATAALYDIHGNLPALEAVLGEIRRLPVERIVVGGDVLPGPMPRESLDALLRLDLPVEFIHGNGERAVLAELAGADPGVPAQVREVIRWTARQIPDLAALLSEWPATLRLEVAGIGTTLFCHATPTSDSDIFTVRTPERVLRPLFEQLGVDLVVCGHTHMPFDRTIGGTRVVNAGSVGMPFGRTGACWLLLGAASGVEPRRTSYDLTAAGVRIRDSSSPQAEDFVSRHVQSCPGESEMLDVFGKAEIGRERGRAGSRP